jgi:hypothetical protein
MSPRMAALAVVLAASCAPPEGPFTCQATANCGDLGGVSTCCTDTRCEYRVANGQTFACQGIDCSAAHAMIRDYCDPHCPDAAVIADAWVDQDADLDAASFDASIDAGPDAATALDAQPCVR